MMARRVIAAVAIAPALDGAATEIYRCTTPGGGVSYQEQPCSRDGVKLDLPTTFPEVDAAARELLLQREAALDRRLEAQRERLSREEMTRITARAQVAAAQAAAAPVVEPVYVFGWPVRMMRMPLRPHRIPERSPLR
jgi:hypothetical protein